MKQENPEIILFDAKNEILGRLSVEIAKKLTGKEKVDYTPHIGGKDIVVVINSDRVRLSGEKAKKKIYYRHSGYPGGIYQATFEEAMEKDSTKVLEHAVKGMLPKNKLSRQVLKRLRIFKDEKHTYGKKLEAINKK